MEGVFTGTGEARGPDSGSSGSAATFVLPESLLGYLVNVSTAHKALDLWELQHGKQHQIIRIESLSGGKKFVYSCVCGKDKGSGDEDACQFEIILCKTLKKTQKHQPFFFNTSTANM